MNRNIMATAALVLIMTGCSATSEQTAPSLAPSSTAATQTPTGTPKPDPLDSFPVQHMTLTETSSDYNVTLDDGSAVPALVLRRSIPSNGRPVKIDPNKSCTTARGGKLICWQSAKIENKPGFPASVVVSLTHDGVECSFSATFTPGDRVLRACNRAAA